MKIVGVRHKGLKRLLDDDAERPPGRRITFDLEDDEIFNLNLEDDHG